jgi:hypothetical protein
MIFNLYKFTHLILKICIFEYFIDIKCQTGSLSYFLPPPPPQPQPQPQSQPRPQPQSHPQPQPQP